MAVHPIELSTERDVVDATLRIIARYGLSKLTVDDVAREAGCSRATLYRRFPGRAALLAAAVASETERLRRGLDEAMAQVATLEEAAAAAAGYGAREFAAHDALQFLLVHEPGTVLPSLCFNGAERLLDVVSDFVAPHLCRFLTPLEARRVAGWLGRIVLSYSCMPPTSEARTPSEAEAVVVSHVRDFVVPALDTEVPGA